MSAVGVVLAGGRGTRLGGDKATAELRGVPLLLRPLRVLAAVTARQAVVAKAATVLPPLPAGVLRWDEPEEPRHPLTGIAHALRQAGGEAILCCAVDLVLLDVATLQALLDADDGRQACVVPRAGGRLEPLCALWRPAALPALAGAAGRMRDVVAALGAREVAFAGRQPFTNVNDHEELARLEADPAW